MRTKIAFSHRNLSRSVPGSCRALGGREAKGNGCEGRHKSVEDDETAKTEHRWVEADRSEWRRGGNPHAPPEAARTVGASLSPPSVAGGVRRTATLLRSDHHPSFPTLLLAFCNSIINYQTFNTQPAHWRRKK